VPTTESTGRTRKQLGAWYTPDELVDLVVERTIDHTFMAGGGRGGDAVGDRPVRVLDPACGDGRFLASAARRLRTLGRDAVLTGVDVDPRAVATVDVPGVELITADALAFDWGRRRFDVVVGNPPFLSQMSTSTTRGGASRHGGGPYADAAAEFLALAMRLAEPDDGRVGLVLPQSILASRDAGPVRENATALASMNWSWWSPRQMFEAQVLVCALGFRLGRRSTDEVGTQRVDSQATWSGVVTDELGVPPLPALATDGTIGDRARCSLNFRDEYYGLVPAVSDDGDGPPLVTCGLIDPGRCLWGERPVRFAKRAFSAPRVDLARLDTPMRAWARRKLVPKVLVANQTRIVEAVADPDGAWLPGVPVSSLVPTREASVWELAAVLTSPVAAAAAWLAAAGTGLSARAIRLGPAALASLPWPAGDVSQGAQLLRDGDVLGCGRAIAAAYADGRAHTEGATGSAGEDPLFEWWAASVNGAAVSRRGSSSAPSRASRRSSTTGPARPTR
jgi:SAM-dependent methyltransferase